MSNRQFRIKVDVVIKESDIKRLLSGDIKGISFNALEGERGVISIEEVRKRIAKDK